MEARAVAAAAGFLSGPDKDDYDNLVDAHDAVIDAIDAAFDPRKRAALIPIKYQLEAWAYSAVNFFRATQQTGSNIPKRVKERELRQPETPLFPALRPADPHVAGR